MIGLTHITQTLSKTIQTTLCLLGHRFLCNSDFVGAPTWQVNDRQSNLGLIIQSDGFIREGYGFSTCRVMRVVVLVAEAFVVGQVVVCRVHFFYCQRCWWSCRFCQWYCRFGQNDCRFDGWV